MARAPIAGSGTSGAARNRIVLSAPAANTTVNYNAPSSRTFVLQDIDPNTLNFERSGSNLEVRFENGAVINLVRFFAVGNRSFANFEMADSNVIAGGDLLAQYKPGLDLTPTAAGPAAPRPAPGGSGVGEYRDGIPDLIGGVDRLGMLGTSYYDQDADRSSDELGLTPAWRELGDDGRVFLGPESADEAGLANGTRPGQGLESAWSPLTLENGVSIQGVPAGGTGQFEGTYVTLYVRHLGGSSYEYMYVLKRPYTSAVGDDERNLEIGAELIPLRITDGEYTGTIRISVNIRDDVPEAVLEDPTGGYMDASDGSFASGYEVTGRWEINYGADGQHQQQPMDVRLTVTPLDENGNPGTPVTGTFDVVLGQEVDLVINGVSYGKITFNADNTYTFVPASNTNANYNIELGARDNDGDRSYSSAADIAVTVPDIDFVIGDNGEWFNEANLLGGTAASPNQTCKDLLLPDGLRVDTSKPSSEGVEWKQTTDADGRECYTLTDEGAYGFLTYYPPTGSGSSYQPPRLTYTLTDNAPHAKPTGTPGASRDEDPSQTFFDENYGKITLLDAAENSFEVDTKFKIYDDAPIVNFDSDSGETVYSGYDAVGTWSVVFGADGPTEDDSRILTVKVEGGGSVTFNVAELASATSGNGLRIEINGVVYGHLKFITGGDFIFTASSNSVQPNTPVKLTMTLTGIDHDGDETSDSLDITIAPPPPPGPLELLDPTPIDESKLVDGDEGDLIREIGIPPGYTIDTSTDGWVPDPNNPGKFQKPTEDGKGMLTYDPKDNTLHYELQEGLDHPDGQNVIPDLVDEITLIDEKGNSFPGNPVEVPIKDDVPSIDVGLEDGGNTVEPGGSIGGDFEIDYGGDGPADKDPVEIIVDVDGKEESFYPPPGGGSVTYPITDKDGNPIGELEVEVDEDGKGHFEFKPDPTAPPGTDVGIEIIGKDKDGSPTEGGEVDISIIDPNGPGVNYISGGPFYEANLEDGTAYAGGSGLTQPLTLPKGTTVDTSQGGWVQQANGSFLLKGTYGDLTCDSTGRNLTYTLLSQAPHEAGKGNNRTTDVINGIVLKGQGGKTYDPLPVKVTIVDDVPEVDLSGGAGGTTIQSGGSYEGNWTVIYGADGPASTAPLQLKATVSGRETTVTIVPGQSAEIVFGTEKFGDITFDAATGKFTFKAAANQKGTLQLELIATDQDHDTVSSYFQIKVEAKDGPGVDSIIVEDGPSESNLGEGTNPDRDALTKPVDLPPGYEVDVTQDGWVIDSNGNYILDPEGPGHLTWNPVDKELTYTLDDPTQHPEKPVDELAIHLKDAEGNTYPVDVIVPIENDIPTAEITSPTDTVESGKGPLVGTWEVDFGADEAASDDPLTLVISTPGCKKPLEIELDPETTVDQSSSVIIDGVDYGTITIKPDGTFTFEPKPDLPPTRLDVELRAEDGDGDVAVTPPFIISIVPPDGPPIGYLTSEEAFDEANFLNGTDPNTGALTKALNLPAGYTVDVTQDGWERVRGTDQYVFKSPVERDANGIIINGFGKLTYDTSTGKLTYTLTEKVYNTPAENDLGRDVISGIKIVDAGGNSFDMKAVVDIRDDKPTLDFSGEDVVKSGHTYTGEWDYNFGADGSADVKPIVISVSDGVTTKEYTVGIGSSTEIALNGKRYGALTLNNDGTYTFKAAPNVTGKLSFGMTITDLDGDQVSDPNKVVLTFESEEIGVVKVDEAFNEANLVNGTSPDANALTKTLTLPKTASGESLVPDTSDWSRAADNTYVKKGPIGTLKWDGTTLTFTLDDNVTHPLPGQSGTNDSVFQYMDITFKDAYDNVYNTKVEVKVLDDAPVFDAEFDATNVDGSQISVESGGTLSGDLGLLYGADDKSPLLSNALQFIFRPDASQNFSVTVPVEVGKPQDVVIGGVKYGTITVNADYTFVFDIEPNLETNFAINFQATDSDGDWAKAFDQDKPIIIKVEPPGPVTSEEPVSETYLPGGTAEGPGSAAQLTKEVTIPEGFFVNTDEGWTSLGNNLFEMDTPHGKLTYNDRTNVLEYTLVRPMEHGAPNSPEDQKKIEYVDLVLENDNGHTFDIQAEIEISDDAPVVGITATETEISSGGTVNGVLSFDHGADGRSTSEYLELVITDKDGAVVATFTDADLRMDGTPLTVGRFGTLTIDSNGNFTFKANPDLTNELSFVLSAKDSDGDISKNDDPFVIKIERPGHEPGDLTYDSPVPEKHLPNGTLPNSGNLNRDIPVETGFRIDVSQDNWISQGRNAAGLYVYEKTGPYGKLTYTVADPNAYSPSDSLVFTLTDRAPHTAPGSADDVVLESTMGKVHYIDNLGNTYEVDTIFPIEDDAPHVELGGKDFATGGEDYTGTYVGLFGADGPASAESARLSVIIRDAAGNAISTPIEEDVVIGTPIRLVDANGRDYGTITFTSNTDYLFEVANNLQAVVDMTLTLTDRDGDVRSASKQIAVDVSLPPAELQGFGYESYLVEDATAGQDYAGSQADASRMTQPIVLPALPDGQQGTWTVDTTASVDGKNWVRAPGGANVWTLEVDYGYLTYTEIAGAQPSLSYTLKTAPAVDADEHVFTVPGLTLKDQYDNTSKVPLKITIVDDEPSVDTTVTDSSTILSGGNLVVGDWNATYGADGPAGNGSMQLRVTNELGEIINLDNIRPDTDINITINGKNYGNLRFDSNTGKFSFSATANSPTYENKGLLSFEVRVVDGDGDISDPDGFMLNISPTPPPIDALETTVDEKYLSNGSEPNGTNLDSLFGFDPALATIDFTYGNWINPPNTDYYYLQLAHGRLIANLDGTELTYRLDKNFDHPAGEGRNSDLEPWPSGIQILDSSGNAFIIPLKVTIIDDVPHVGFGNDPSVTPDPVTGDVSCGETKAFAGAFDFSFGADGAADEDGLMLTYTITDENGRQSTQTVFVSHEGTATELRTSDNMLVGKVTFDQATQKFVFEAARDVVSENKQLTVDMHLTATDGDGDVVESGHFVVTVTKPDGPDFDTWPDLSFNEAHLPGGSLESTDPANFVKTINMVDKNGKEWIPDTTGWTSEPDGTLSLTGTFGTGKLVWDAANNSLTYHFLKIGDHGGNNGPNSMDDVFDNFKFMDKDLQNTYEEPCRVEIIDDVPATSLTATNTDISSGGTVNGVLSYHHGADGKATSEYLELVITDKDGTVVATFTDADLKMDGSLLSVGQYGTLTIDSNGNFTFKANPNLTNKLSFVLSAKDSDGDISRNDDPFEIDIKKPDPELKDLTYDSPVPEKHLPNGTLPNSGNLNRDIPIETGYRIDVTQDNWVSLGRDPATNLYVYEKTGPYGKLTYSVANPDAYSPGDSLVFTLTDRAPHTAPGTADDVFLQSTMGTVHYIDNLGNTYDVGTIFPIEDDAPYVELVGKDSATGGEDYTGTYVGLFGADGPAATDSQKLEVLVTDADGSIVPFTIDEDVVIGTPIQLVDPNTGKDYGTITFTSKTDYLFEVGNNVNAIFDLTLTLTDADGDVRSATKKIAVDVTLPPSGLEGYGYESYLVEDPTAGQAYPGSQADASRMTQPIVLPPLPDGQQGTWMVDTTVNVNGRSWVRDPGGASVWTLEVDYGYLTYTERAGAQPSLSYTLTTAPTEDVVEHVFTVPGLTLKDQYANTSEVPLKITIVDDEPSVDTTVTDSTPILSGNDRVVGDWDATYGADGPAGTGSMRLRVTNESGETINLDNIRPDTDINITINGKNYGDLRFDSTTGKFSFSATGNSPTYENRGLLSFELRVVDGDGDISDPSGFTLNILPTDPPIPALETTVDEKYLSNGSEPDSTKLDSVFNFDPALATIDFTYGNWINPPNTDYYYLQLGHGRLIANMDGTQLTYKLDKNYGHTPGGGRNTALEPWPNGIQILDSSGNTFIIPLKVTIIDDVPHVGFGNDPAVTPDPVTGSVVCGEAKEFDGAFDFSFGADGAADTNGLMLTYTITDENGTQTTRTIFVSHEGTAAELRTSDNLPIGKVTFDQSTKKFVFEALPDVVSENAQLTVDMHLTAKDGDGDVVESGHFVVTVTKPDGPDFDTWPDLKFYEEYLTGGTNESTNQDNFVKTINMVDNNGKEWIPDTTGWTREPDGTLSLTGTFGTGKLIWDATNETLTYHFLKAGDHGGLNDGKNSEFDEFNNFKFMDKDLQNTYEEACRVEIVDDAPLASIRVDNGNTVSGDPFNGSLSYHFGADGADGAVAADGLSLVVTAGGHDTVLSGTDLKMDGTPMNILGADGTVWGTLTINANGSFVYQSMPSGPGQDKSGMVTFEFSVKDSDGDITSQVVSKEIRSHDAPPWSIGDNQFFDEANLVESPTHGYPGTNQDASSLTKPLKEVELNGYTLSPLPADGWVETINGTNVWQLQGTKGYLTYNANTKALTFTLTTSADHTNANIIGSADDYIESFGGSKITVIDSKGNASQVPIKIHIYDDGPQISNFEAPLEMVNGSLPSGGTFSGNVKCNFGADGPADQNSLMLEYIDSAGQRIEVPVTYGTAISIDMGGVKGTITFNSGGGYQIKTDVDQTGKWKFDLVAKDGDNDTTRATLELDVAKPQQPDIEFEFADSFDESYLPGGTNEGLTVGTNLRQEFDLKGLVTVDTTGWATEGTNKVLEAGNGRYVYTSNNRLFFEVTKPYDHDSPASGGWDRNTADIDIGNVVIILRDSYGNTYTAGKEGSGSNYDVKMTVVDDAPAQFQINIDSSGNVRTGEDVDGVITRPGRPGADPLDVGADGPGGTTGKDGLTITVTLVGTANSVILSDIGPTGGSQDVTINGVTYGTLTVNRDGTFTFKSETNKDGNALHFAFRLEDNDGDVYMQDTTIRILPGDSPEPYLTFKEIFNEANLLEGTAPNDLALRQSVVMDSKFDVLNEDNSWVENGNILTRTGTNGILTYDRQTHTFYYELTGNADHSQSANDIVSNVFDGISLIDGAGNKHYNYLTVEAKIKDDEPTLDITDSSTSRPALVTSGDIYTNGKWEHKFGADEALNGEDDKVSLTVTVGSSGGTENYTLTIGVAQRIEIDRVFYGMLTLKDDGTYEFDAEPNHTVTLNLEFSIADTDGDTATASTAIRITKPDADVPDITGGNVSESALPPPHEGTGGGTATTPIDLTDAAANGYTIDTRDTTVWVPQPNGTLVNSKDPNGNLIYNPADGSLIYELTTPMDHTSPGRDSAVKVIPDITFVDGFGNTYDFDIEFNVVDDIPVVNITDSISMQTGTTDDSGVWSVKYGADGESGAPDRFVITIKEGNTVIKTVTDYNPGDEIDLPGYGKLTLAADGKVIFTGLPDEEFTIDVVISATDGDGDTNQKVNDTLVIATHKSPPPIFPAPEVFEKYLGNGTEAGQGDLVFWINPTDTSHPNYNATNAEFKVDVSTGGWRPLAGDPNTYFLAEIDSNNTLIGPGRLLCDSDGSNLRYELVKAAGHDAPPAGELNNINDYFDLFSRVVVKDQHDNTHTVQIRAKVVDDIPQVEFDKPEDTIKTGETYDGDYELSFGADSSPDGGVGVGISAVLYGPDGTTVIGRYNNTTGLGSVDIIINGRNYGSLVLTAGNKFQFIAKPALVDDPVGTIGFLNFAINVTDRDGDKTDDAIFKLELEKPDLPLPPSPGDMNVYESSLPDGTDPGALALTKEWDLGTEFKVDTSNWTEVNGVYTMTNGKGGTLTWVNTGGENKIVYTLHDPATHQTQGNDTIIDAFNDVILLDSLGNAYKYRDPVTGKGMEITIVDDMPELGAGTSEGISENPAGGGESFTSEGTFELQLGADDVPGKTADTFTMKIQFQTVSQEHSGLTSYEIEIPRIGTQGTPIVLRTKLGKFTLEYDPATDTVTYKYEAARGAKDDYEKITYSLTDSDKDVVTKDFTITLDDDVKEAKLVLDEAALPFGSNSSGSGSRVDSDELRDLAFDERTVDIEWDMDFIRDSLDWLKADGDRDGNYETVTWAVDGNALVGTADGITVIRITPEFVVDPATNQSYFTGRISAELMRPFEHTQPGNDLELSFDLKFNQTNAAGDSVPSIVQVKVVDDTPFTDSNAKPINVEEIPERFEEVFIALDFSNSMDEKIDRSDDAPTRWQVAVDSLLRLVRAYEENGIQATFTLVAFATSATVNPAFSGITGSDFLALYEELGGDDAARDTLASLIKQDNTSGVVHDVDGLGIGGETNYNLATQLLMQELDKAMNDPARADIEKSVFFMSDGVSTSGNPTAWYEYLRQHPDDFNTYAIGMGSAVTDAAKNMLVEVTGGKDENFVMVDDFSDLGDVLVSFIEPVSGNILENLGSADANTLKSIWILAVADENDQSSQQDVMQNGREYTFPADGSPLEISLGDPQNPVKMTIQPDGSYKVTSGNVSNDFPYRIVLEIDDADGDTVTTQAITLILKDAEPKAYDNIGVYDTFDGAQNNLSSDQGGFTGSNTAGWLLTNGRFEVKAGGETVPESGLPSNLLGSHYLHLASRTGAESASLYMDHLGNRMYLWDIAESLGFGPNELLNMGPGIAQRYSMASTSVSATEGQISFGWTARGDAGDVSFYLLVDSKGQIVRSGVLSRLGVSGTDSGVATIDIPLNNGDEEYRIVFGTFDGRYNGSSGSKVSELFINAVVVEESAYDYKGNILTDPSPNGDVDLMYDMAYLLGLTTKGGVTNPAWQFYDANGNLLRDQIEITTSNGTLIVNKNGDYIYKVTNPNTDPKSVLDEFTYQLRDRDGSVDDADLIIRWQKPLAIEKEAMYDENGEFKGNVMTDQNAQGETDECYSSTYLTSATIGGNTHNFTSANESHTFTTSQGTLELNANGTYTFTPNRGVSPDAVNQELTYTLRDGDADQGKLIIRVSDPYAYDNVAPSAEVYLSKQLIDTFANGVGEWEGVGSTNLRVTVFPSRLLKPQGHESLDEYLDNTYLNISTKGVLQGAELEEMFNLGNTINVTSLEERLADMGLEDVAGVANGQLSGAFASRTFETTGGKLVFDWAFGGTQSTAGFKDAAIYILQDANGNIVSSGTLAQLLTQGVVRKYGVAEIEIPGTSASTEYTLYIGQVMVGSGTARDTELVIGTVVVEEDRCQFAGNMIEDASPSGMEDFVAPGSTIESVRYDGVDYSFKSGEDSLTILTGDSGGKLIVHKNGDYYYSDTPGADGSLVAEDFEYTVKMPNGNADTAMLFIRGDAYLVEGDKQETEIDLTSILYGKQAPYLVTGSSADEEITAGMDNTVIYGGGGADTFAWNKVSVSSGGQSKDMIMDFSTKEEDKLSFKDLFDSGENIGDFFRDHITNVDINTEKSTLSFTIQDGGNVKDVEVNFVANDSGFQALADSNPNEDAIINFLIQHTITS